VVVVTVVAHLIVVVDTVLAVDAVDVNVAFVSVVVLLDVLVGVIVVIVVVIVIDDDSEVVVIAVVILGSAFYPE